MKRFITIIVMTLVATACAGSDADTSTTTSAITTTTPTTSAATTSTTVAETTTSTTAASTPSTNAWETWTLVLASIEVGAEGAEERANEIAASIDGAGVVYSSDFPSLNPGFWVVNWGEFASGSEASNWCAGIPNALTCYPRYLGPAVSPLAADGNAMVVEDHIALAIVDVATGERLKVIDPNFGGDGLSVGRMALTPDAGALYFGVGGEDSWYSCESSRGEVWRLDLGFGTTTAVAAGFGPTVSPDGRWLALLDSEQCFPDPAQPDFWVMTPADTVVLYNLSTGRPVETKRWSVATPPTSYDDPRMITWADWRSDSQTLLVANNGGDLFELALDYEGSINAGEPLVTGIDGSPQALIGNTLYVVRDETPDEWGGFDILAVDVTTGAPGEVVTQMVGWPYVAADTTRTRLIWGSDTQAWTAEGTFSLETYLGGFAW